MPSVTRKPRLSRAERQEQRRDAIRRRLLAALEALLDDGGSFTELPVEALIREAGVARSTFYVYFEDKGDLLLTLAQDVVDDLLVGAADWLSLEAGATQDDLEAALRRFAATYVQHRVIVAAIAETAPHDARLGELLDTRLDQLVRELAGHLAAGQERGLVRRSLDPEPIAVWVSALLERGLHQLAGPGTPAEPDRAAAALAPLLWNALYREPAA
ncbi:TetR/AcrR family transcriptional regulator [Conexibacter sp. SYSU D00693]|uniref:TetR/AcrR family transcriptional regulator n=1 Tax=Conexibacter sp. SYSU D00693 TaxID=2812560 RepID=UPI00196AA1A4|nr:TetR/AcrR family transcriptional regulator [Conexibacter sp. SYSU D00693]